MVSAFSNHKPLGEVSLIKLPIQNRKKAQNTEQPKVIKNVRAFVKITNAIQAANIPKGVSVKSEARGLNIRVSDDALFSSGSATLRPEVKEFLELITGLVKGLPNYIAVEGHSDSQPIRSGAFPSNWELSASRASILVRFFTETHQLDPKRFSATSFAGYRPLESNDTKKGRSANRRVEIIILRHEHAPPVERNPYLDL